MTSYHLLVVTPDGVAFDGECESLIVRTQDGDVEILASKQHPSYLRSYWWGNK